MALSILVRPGAKRRVSLSGKWLLPLGLIALLFSLDSDWYDGIVSATSISKWFVGDRYIYCQKSDHLRSVFKLAGWDLDNTVVPRIYTERLPRDFPEISDVNERKRLFLEIMLPIVLKVNEEIEEEAKLFEKVLMGSASPESVSHLLEKYELDELDSEIIRLRVRPVPVWQVLAQAALESGWGTSRFAMHANNLMGEQVFEPGSGLLPDNRPKDAIYEVRVFRSLIAALRRYVTNLNTHESYKEYRLLRARTGNIRMLEGLKYYSIERDAYIEKLELLINHEGLLRYDGYTLESFRQTELTTQRVVDVRGRITTSTAGSVLK